MEKQLWQRRKLLRYIGLGIVGVGASAVWQRSLATSSQTTTAPSPLPEATSEAIAATTRQPLPEFQGISQWLNSAPLTTASLKGQVTLVQFWTFACINCQRTLPHITQWHRQYQAQGLRVIGVHTPEFAYERQVNNVQDALKKHQITYPVPIDNEFKTWNAYKNEYWPHLFLADRQGNIRYHHIGEGAYAETEQMIRQLLG
jgi:thiol-disulfide isomerase/thioredoxin